MVRQRRKKEEVKYTGSDYTVKQVASMLQVSVARIRLLISDRKLQYYKVGERGTRISKQQLDKFRQG